MDDVEPMLSGYLAEWYQSGLSEQAVDDAIAGLRRALTAVADPASPVTLLAMVAAPTDEVLYGVFGAASPSAVIRACTTAGYPIDRLTVDVDARILVSDPPPDPGGCREPVAPGS